MQGGEVSLHRLAQFVAIAEAGSLSAAAARLGYSPSAVAASLDELERELGSRLCVRRRSQGVTLTPAGRRVLVRAVRLLKEAAELRHSLGGDGDELVGPLVVGCYATLAPTVLPALLVEFEERHPEVHVDIVEGAQEELHAALDDGTIDLAILYDLGGLEELERRVLTESRAYAVLGARHPLAGAAQVSPAQLADYPFVQFDQAPSTRYALSVFDGGPLPHVRHHTRSFEFTRALVARSAENFGILVQHPLNRRSAEDLPVVEKEIVPAPAPVPVVVAWVRGVEPSPRARAFAELALAQVGATTPA